MIPTPAPHVVTLAPVAAPARWLVLDLETGNAPEEAIQQTVNAWKAPKNWKPATVERNRAEAAIAIREKAALLDASPILCVGVRPNAGAAVMFSGMPDPGPLDLAGGWSVASPLVADGTPAGDPTYERGMLANLRTWLDVHADNGSVLVGHNVRGFDLPKLRNAYVRHRLTLPLCLRPREGEPDQPVTDTMRLFERFSMEHRDSPFVSLDTVCSAFGLPRPKQYITGADTPRLFDEGQYAEILTYCAIDVDVTAEIYRLMMS